MLRRFQTRWEKQRANARRFLRKLRDHGERQSIGPEATALEGMAKASVRKFQSIGEIVSGEPSSAARANMPAVADRGGIDGPMASDSLSRRNGPGSPARRARQ